MAFPDENDGKEEETAAAEAPEAAAAKADDDDQSPLSLDLMDIFDSEDMVEPTIAIPGLQNLTMNEVASETESILEDVRSRFLS